MIKCDVGAISMCFDRGLEVSSDGLNLGHVFSTIVGLRKTSNNHRNFGTFQPFYQSPRSPCFKGFFSGTPRL